ncbi:MAG TPA: alpha/beta fold hydrolase [Mesorhizobium sp.]
MSLTAILGWMVLAALFCAALFVGSFVFRTRRIAAWAEKEVPPAGKFIVIGGQRLHYVEAGEGPPILFIHGLGAQLHHFKGTIFDSLEDRYRLIALDRPGSGYSTRPMFANAGLYAQAATIAGFIDALGLERPLVVGHSLGGAVALALAVEHPEKIGGLALIAPLSHYLGHIPPAFASLNIKSPWMRRFLSETFAVPTSLKFAEQTLDFVFRPQRPPEDYGVRGGGLSGLRPSHIYAAGTDFVDMQADLAQVEDRYGEIDMPVGVFFGMDDRVLDPKLHGEALRDRIKAADVEIVEGIGHMPQFIVPERVVAFVDRIASRVNATSVVGAR